MQPHRREIGAQAAFVAVAQAGRQRHGGAPGCHRRRAGSCPVDGEGHRSGDRGPVGGTDLGVHGPGGHRDGDGDDAGGDDGALTESVDAPVIDPAIDLGAELRLSGTAWRADPGEREVLVIDASGTRIPVTNARQTKLTFRESSAELVFLMNPSPRS